MDIAFLIGEVKQEGFFNTPFYSYSLIWVVSPKLTLPPEPVSLSELAKIPIITYPRMSEPHANIRTLITKMSSSTQIHSSSSLSTIIRMALDGIGVSALPKEIIARELASGQLREFEVEANIPDLVFNMAYCAAPGANVVRAVADLSLKIVAPKPL
ncbi:LysR substrate-binding domain-containing protein [Marinobacter sp.]|uniref:LysR substrate-binding domain-containing protein n=1 Tax=Marinobacter sp. TaxID=50741 RepID=UPI003F955D10